MGKFDNVRGFTTSFEPNPRYMAPETFPSEDDDGIRLTFQSDVFSFGMLMLQVCSSCSFIFFASKSKIL